MKFIGILLALVLTNPSFAQDGAWKEMDAFHEVVRTALHPVETGNLKPLKSNSALLLEKVLAWKKSTAPSTFQYPQLQADMDKLVADCTSLDAAVKAKKSNKDIKQLAMQTHDHFHAIMSATKKKST